MGRTACRFPPDSADSRGAAARGENLQTRKSRHVCVISQMRCAVGRRLEDWVIDRRAIYLASAFDHRQLIGARQLRIQARRLKSDN